MRQRNRARSPQTSTLKQIRKTCGKNARIISAGLLIALTVAGCGYASIAYKPPFTPITFSIDTHGTISVHGEAKFVTPLGEFSVEAGIFKDTKSNDGSLLVIIRHKQEGAVFYAAYTINADEQLKVTLNGKIVLSISSKQVYVDATAGRITSLEITSVSNQPTSAAPESSASSQNANRAQPSILYSDPLTSSSHPDSPPNSYYQGSGYLADGFHIYGDSGINFLGGSYGDADISVTVRWIAGGSSSEFGIEFRASNDGAYTYWIRGDGTWGVSTPEGGAVVAPRSSRYVHIGTNRLEVRMKGRSLKFFIDGHELGKVSDGTSLSGDMGLYGYGDGASSQFVFTDLLVTSVR